MTERKSWGADRQYQHSRELSEKRAAWERGREMEQEAERLAGLRQEMQTYRRESLEEWMDHGGDEASFRQVWPNMMRRYLDEKTLTHQAEREAKLLAAEEDLPV